MSFVERPDRVDFEKVSFEAGDAETASSGPSAGSALESSALAAVTAAVAPDAAGAAPLKPEGRSEAQLVYDRLLEQCNRFNRIRRRMVSVTELIAPAKAKRAVFVEGGAKNPELPKSFFDGLHMLADGSDLVADEIERALDDLESLF